MWAAHSWRAPPPWHPTARRTTGGHRETTVRVVEQSNRTRQGVGLGVRAAVGAAVGSTAAGWGATTTGLSDGATDVATTDVATAAVAVTAAMAAAREGRAPIAAEGGGKVVEPGVAEKGLMARKGTAQRGA